MATKNRVKVTNQNESWFSLAKRFLQDEGKAGQLAKANPGVYALKKGMTVKLPAVPAAKKQNTGWQGGFRVPTGSGDVTGQYPAVRKAPFVPLAQQQLSQVTGGAAYPLPAVQAASVRTPAMATTTGLPINEDDYTPGKVPGTYVPGVGRVPTPGKLPGVGPTLPGYIPPKKVVPRIVAPQPSLSNLSVAMGANPGTYQSAFISGAATGAAAPLQNTGWQGGFTVPTGSGDITGQYPPMYANNWRADQSGLAPASPYLSPYAYNVPVEFQNEGKPGTTMVEMLAAGQRPKSITIPVQKYLGASDSDMIAAGYTLINGVWVDNASQAPVASSSGGGGGGGGGRLRSSTGRGGGGGGGRSTSYGGYGTFPGQQGYYVNPALLGLVSWRI